MLDHRHPRFPADPFDQPLAATRHNHIHIVSHADQFADGGAIRRFDDLHRVGGQASGGQTLLNTGGYRLIGMQRLGAAAQNGGVAGLQAQGSGVGGHVRA